MAFNELLSDSTCISVQSGGDNHHENMGEVIQLVSFMIDDVEYGVNILSVHEILKYPNITRLPNTPGFIKGVINLRGNVLPVVDLRIRFGFPSGEITDLTRIIVIETNGKQVGLLVDNAYQVVKINRSKIFSSSDFVVKAPKEFVSGIFQLKDRFIVVLNVSNLLFSENDR